MKQDSDMGKEEKFDEFLMIMDDQIDALENDAQKRGFHLEIDLSSLEALEDLFMQMKSEVATEEVSKLFVYFGRYLGEIVRTTYGGKWFLPLNDKKNVNYNIHVIIGHSPVMDLEFDPIGLMRALSIKEKKGLLRRAIDADVHPSPIHIEPEK